MSIPDRSPVTSHPETDPEIDPDGSDEFVHRHIGPTADEIETMLGVVGATSLGALSPELRAVVQATVLDGLTTKEAARLLGVPAGTVKTRMMRAKRQMREALA